MIKTKTITEPHEILDTLVCDKCGFETSELSEMGEFHSVRLDAGYGSKYFGDGTKVECDLCEKCLYELIKDFARIL
jgi:hypothetical protein